MDPIKIDTNRGFFPCGEGIDPEEFQCMSFKDYKIHKGNDQRLAEAHAELRRIIIEMNEKAQPH